VKGSRLIELIVDIRFLMMKMRRWRVEMVLKHEAMHLLPGDEQ
jgi:hypothetical protein